MLPDNIFKTFFILSDNSYQTALSAITKLISKDDWSYKSNHLNLGTYSAKDAGTMKKQGNQHF